MPRVTFECKKRLTDNIFEVKEVTYEIPSNIYYKGNSMSYNPHWKTYYGDTTKSELKAEAYIKEEILKNKKSSLQNDLSKYKY